MKIIYSVFAIAILLAMGAFTANSESGDLFVSVDGAPGNGFICKYIPAGCETRLLMGSLALAG